MAGKKRAASSSDGLGMLGGRTFDVLPDRIDLRDRAYLPPLRSLPSRYPAPTVIKKYLPAYAPAVRNQGQEGACTGFGLAAVVNFLLWTRNWRGTALMVAALDGAAATHPSGAASESGLPDVAPPDVFVSPRMLYQMARHYDEWAGEDYEGSSCRGAMKGWHKHGVCSEATWKYDPGKFIKPTSNWQEEAAAIPLGAYYRVDKDAINDLQSALFEIGALYVSALVHDGWELKPADSLDKAVIRKPRKKQRGGHAFALVGYNGDGFIVQNSWGSKWAFGGFALLPYEDWLHHATDAWAASLGVPIHDQTDNAPVEGAQGQQTLVRQVAWVQALKARGVSEARISRTADVTPWNALKACSYSVVQGDDGRPLHRQPEVESADDAVRNTCFRLPRDFFAANGTRKLVIYAHGGLNSESASIDRTRVLAPFFDGNGIFPIFYAWRSGFQETVERIVRGEVENWLSSAGLDARLPAGWSFDDITSRIDRFRERLADQWDRAIEAGCRAGVRPVWTQMKQSAGDGTAADGALRRMIEVLAELNKELKKNGDPLEIHLVGHSAGSLVLGHLLGLLKGAKLAAKTCTLWAPACTVEFANEHYRPAIDGNVLAKNGLFCEILSDSRERADTVGPYRKSLLYLVSRALETQRDAALLGMELAWSATDGNWDESQAAAIQSWLDFRGRSRAALEIQGDPTVSNGLEMIKAAHGAFDNDVKVVERLISRITGKKPPACRVTNLSGF
jgi:Papain family cysteine protease